MSAFDDGLWMRLVDEHEADRVALESVPEQRSKRPLLVGVSGVAAVSVAGVLAVVLSLAGGAGSAFAGWTPQPTTPTAAQLAAARAYCDRNVPSAGAAAEADRHAWTLQRPRVRQRHLERFLHHRSVISKRVRVDHIAPGDGARRKVVSLGRAHDDRCGGRLYGS